VLSSCLPGMAQEKNGWHYELLGSKSDNTEPDAQRVYEILLKCSIAGMPTTSKGI
jgi:hypothetical protein